MKTLNTSSFYLVVSWLLFSTGLSLAQSPSHDDSMDDPSSYYSSSTKEAEPYLDSDEIAPGTTIKIHLEANNLNDDRGYGYLEGRFQSIDNGVLYMSVDGTTVGTRTEDIYELKVRTGSGGGALVGAMVGLAAGGLLAAAAQPDRSESGLSGLSHMEDDIAQGTALVLLGVAVGAGIGGTMDKGKWKNVQLDHQTFGLLGQFSTDYRVAYRFWF